MAVAGVWNGPIRSLLGGEEIRHAEQVIEAFDHNVRSMGVARGCGKNLVDPVRAPVGSVVEYSGDPGTFGSDDVSATVADIPATGSRCFAQVVNSLQNRVGGRLTSEDIVATDHGIEKIQPSLAVDAANLIFHELSLPVG